LGSGGFFQEAFGPAFLFVQWFQESGSSWGRTLALGPGISQASLFKDTLNPRTRRAGPEADWYHFFYPFELGSGGFFLEVIGFWTSMLVCPVVPGVRILLGENLGPRTWRDKTAPVKEVLGALHRFIRSRDIRCCAVLLQDQTSPPVSSTTYYRNIKIHHMYGT
ncbi:hypothetical protein Hamer_G028608, partial [Homarus americanus]